MGIIVEELECEIRRKDEEIDFWKGEVDYWMSKHAELENRYVNQNVDEFRPNELKEELEDYRTKYDALYGELERKNMEFDVIEGKLKDLSGTRVATETELSKYKMMCDKLNDWKEEFQKRCEENEKQADLGMNNELDMEKKLEGYETKYHELCVRFTVEKVRGTCLDNEIKENRKMCVQMNKQIASLEEDIKAIREEGEICFELNRKKCDELERERRRVADENEVLKAKFSELESQTALWLKELEGSGKHHGLSWELEGKEVECEWYKNPLKNLTLIKHFYDTELDGFKTAFSGMKEKFMGLEEDRKVMAKSEMRSQERTTHLEEIIVEMEKKLEMQDLKLEDENSTQRCLDCHDYGEREWDIDTNKRPCSEMDGVIDDAHVVASLTIEDKMLNNTEEIHLFEQDSLNPAGISEIDDNNDERTISPKSFCCTGGKRSLNVPTGNTTEGYFKRSFSDQRCDQERGSICEEDDIPLSSAAKRRRFSKIVTSDTEEDGTTPLGEPQEKKLEELLVIPKTKYSPVNLCAGDVSLSSGGQNVEEFIPLSQQGQGSLTECDENKNQADGSLVEEFTSSNNLEMSGSSQVTVGNLNAQNDQDKVSEREVGVSLSGLFVNGSESFDGGDSSSDSEDTLDNELDIGQVVAMMRRKTNKELKWKNEADVLSSFERHPVLCMKAVCALHRQKTDEGKSIMGPFSKFAVHRYIFHKLVIFINFPSLLLNNIRNSDVFLTPHNCSLSINYQYSYPLMFILISH
ncbi:hypothetical protein MKX01_039309 [Papaver californicum]|nr:hypothetical protein MKX01_039309 [Papaver californicum]